jgi:polyisoprenoid-binding protein YceI
MKSIRWSRVPEILLGVIVSFTNPQASNLESIAELTANLAPPIIEFKVKVLGILPISGRFRDVSGRIIDSGRQGEFTVNIAVHAKSVNTSDPARDRFLRSAAFFHVDQYPLIRFEEAKIIRNEAGAPQLIGDLTLHGQTRRVPFTLARAARKNCKPAADSACYIAHTTISRSDFGLDGFRLIASDEVEITVYLEQDVVALLSDSNPSGPRRSTRLGQISGRSM